MVSPGASSGSSTVTGRSHQFTGALDATGKVVLDRACRAWTFFTSPAIPAPPTWKRYWRITRPDGMTYWFDNEGYPTLRHRSQRQRAGVRAGADRVGLRSGRAHEAGHRRSRTPAVESYLVDYFEEGTRCRAVRVRGNVRGASSTTRAPKLLFDYYRDGNLRTLTQVGGVSAEGGRGRGPDDDLHLHQPPRATRPRYPTPTARKNPSAATTQSVKLYSSHRPHSATRQTFSYWGAPAGREEPVEAPRRWTDREQNTTTFTHDWSSRVTTSDAPLQRDNEYTYDTAGKVTRIVNANEETTTSPAGPLTTR